MHPHKGIRAQATMQRAVTSPTSISRISASLAVVELTARVARREAGHYPRNTRCPHEHRYQGGICHRNRAVYAGPWTGMDGTAIEKSGAEARVRLARIREAKRRRLL